MGTDGTTQDELRAVDHDPVIDAYKTDIDRSLLRENLRKSVEERILALIALQRLADEARRAGRDIRKSA